MLDEPSDAPDAACAIPGTATAAAPPAAMPRKARRFSELSVELVTSLKDASGMRMVAHVVIT
jgi:hypothetical protein